jgi:hypothetical protein
VSTEDPEFQTMTPVHAAPRRRIVSQEWLGREQHPCTDWSARLKSDAGKVSISTTTSMREIVSTLNSRG